MSKWWFVLRNLPALWRAFLTVLGMHFAKLTGSLTMVGTLHAQVIHADGTKGPKLFCGKRSVTDAGVAFLVDDWDDGSTDIGNFNFHDSGTGIVAENVTDTGLGTPAGPARIAGTKSQPAANQLRTIATIAYTATLAITEHGVFSAITVGTLWDRTVFAAINVVNTDSIQFTYTLTVNAGG